MLRSLPRQRSTRWLAAVLALVIVTGLALVDWRSFGPLLVWGDGSQTAGSRAASGSLASSSYNASELAALSLALALSPAAHDDDILPGEIPALDRALTDGAGQPLAAASQRFFATDQPDAAIGQPLATDSQLAAGVSAPTAAIAATDIAANPAAGATGAAGAAVTAASPTAGTAAVIGTSTTAASGAGGALPAPDTGKSPGIMPASQSPERFHGIADSVSTQWTFPMKYSPSTPAVGVFAASRSGRLHAAIDLYAPQGTAIYAMTAGKVREITVFYQGLMAIDVENDDGTTIRYGEMIQSVQVGDHVERGQLLGKLKRNYDGTCMLHLEIYASIRPDPLTQIDNMNDYPLVPAQSRSFRRRSDLVNPGAIYTLVPPT